jgi:hypothetical protein
MVDKIRDPKIREIVTARLREFGIEPGRGGGKIPTEAWKQELQMPSGVPIRKVRLVIPSESLVPIRGGSVYVQPGNTHHVCLFELQGNNGKPKRDAVFVSMLEAARRIKNKEPLIQRTHPEHPQAKYLFSLSGNEMVLLEHNGTTGLYRFETAASTSKQMWFRHHAAGGKSSDKLGVISKMPNTLVARKVTVDPLGRIRWAND